MADRVAVILSQGQSHHPAKRRLEESIAAGLAPDGRLEVIVIPSLYDLRSDDPVLDQLRSLPGDLIVLSWLYPRATHWTLDRHGIRGRLGETSLTAEGGDRPAPSGAGGDRPRSDPRELDRGPLPPRTIHHLDLRAAQDAQPFIAEVRRIASPTPLPAEASWPSLRGPVEGAAWPAAADQGGAPPRRWYPVIDYSRCTNCMECIDFCLFGVFGIDPRETILVEQPDNCRKGCPACSRICPEGAIIFPHHKTPAIAGDPGVVEGRKIDLSQLFGRPTELEIAARERDEHLRRAERGGSARPDELDELIDELDRLDL